MEMPISRPKTTPKDFFLNLGAIAALYFLVINLIQLVFQTIDVAFPPTPESAGVIPSISFPIAALIIGFPLYLLLIRIAVRGETIDPTRRELPVRKWLAYLTLFIAGVAIAIDLIFLLNRFLGGEEITVGFILKVIAVLVVSGVIFGYYLSDLRYRGTRPMRTYFAAGGAVLVIAAISFGFSVFGSPATQRALRFDAERVSDLQTIQWQIVAYWQAKDTVPPTLDAVNDPTRGVQVPSDPVTGKAYGYEMVSATSFKICADFERVSPKTGTAAYYGVPKIISTPEAPQEGSPFIGGGDYWEHGTGTACFERTIDPSYFPKTTTSPR